RRRYLPPLRGGLIRGALSPNRRLGEGTPLLGQWGRGQCRTRGSGWSRGRSCWWERLPPTSRLTSFGGRNLPPFAYGSGGQSQGGGIRISPPWSGSGAGEYGRRPGGGASGASRFLHLGRFPPSPASWGTDPGDFVPQPKVGGRDPTAGAVG